MWPSQLDWIGADSMSQRSAREIISDLQDYAGEASRPSRDVALMFALNNEEGDSLDAYGITDWSATLTNSAIGADFAKIVDTFGGIHKIADKVDQMHRIGARRFGSLWLWANTVVSAPYQIMLGRADVYNSQYVTRLFQGFCVAAAWELCEKERANRSQPARGKRKGAAWAQVRRGDHGWNRSRFYITLPSQEK